MKDNRTDYNTIASTYNQRYNVDKLDGIAKALNELIARDKPNNVLEVGCGTGRWLADLNLPNTLTIGLDRSRNMITQARQNKISVPYVNGDAISIPVKDSSFDFVYCVNAIHHFSSTLLFINEANRILKKNGILAIIGFDPHDEDNEWYVYEYFENIFKNDLSRYPSWNSLKTMSKNLGFIQIDFKQVEKIYRSYKGENIFNDPFLLKHNTSQLASLSDDEYSIGIENLKTKIRNDSETVFTSKFIFRVLTLQLTTK
ncbi:MAG: SAM-dependent methyltransferase [Ignavibacteriales bacterium]|nr:MAG: SAM-dependent methyltransferase [Ignavibacteriales bacterium]